MKRDGVVVVDGKRMRLKYEDIIWKKSTSEEKDEKNGAVKAQQEEEKSVNKEDDKAEFKEEEENHGKDEEGNTKLGVEKNVGSEDVEEEKRR